MFEYLRESSRVVFGVVHDDQAKIAFAAMIIFILTAMGGVVLASNVLNKNFSPWVVSVLHALLGASGLGVWSISSYKEMESRRSY